MGVGGIGVGVGGTGVGVNVGGTGVGVFVGGMGVGVSVGIIGVGVPGTGVSVGGIGNGVAVGAEVAVGGIVMAGAPCHQSLRERGSKNAPRSRIAIVIWSSNAVPTI